MTERLPDSSDICRADWLLFQSMGYFSVCRWSVTFAVNVDDHELMQKKFSCVFFFAKIKKMKKCASQKLSRRSEKETRFEYNGYLSLKRNTEQHQRNEMRKMSRSSAAVRQWKRKILNVGELPMRHGKDHCDDSIVT